MTDWDQIQTALEAGNVVLLPTETVYGLAAQAGNPDAITKIYDIKGRDFDKPLAVCVKDIAQARNVAEFDKISLRLAEKHWPGSLTLVLNLRKDTNLDPRVTSNFQGIRTVALRCPDADWRKHIEKPLALTSANRSGEPDCVSYAAAMEALGDEISASLGTEAPLSGAPSTVLRVDAGKFTVLRQGALEITP